MIDRSTTYIRMCHVVHDGKPILHMCDPYLPFCIRSHKIAKDVGTDADIYAPQKKMYVHITEDSPLQRAFIRIYIF